MRYYFSSTINRAQETKKANESHLILLFVSHLPWRDFQHWVDHSLCWERVWRVSSSGWPHLWDDISHSKEFLRQWQNHGWMIYTDEANIPESVEFSGVCPINFDEKKPEYPVGITVFCRFHRQTWNTIWDVSTYCLGWDLFNSTQKKETTPHSTIEKLSEYYSNTRIGRRRLSAAPPSTMVA